jgi:hypothetical protein
MKTSTLCSLDPWQECQEGRLAFTSFLEDVERRCRERVMEESCRCHGMVFRPCRFDDGAGPSNAPPPPSGASGADAAGKDSANDALF